MSSTNMRNSRNFNFVLKSPFFLLVFLSLFSGCLVANPALAEDTREAGLLTSEEQAWLAEHGSAVRVSLVNLPPLQFEQDGEFTGYQVDILEAVLRKAGLRPVYTMEPFAKVFADLEQKKTEISLDFIPTGERAKVVLFSKKKFDIYMGIFARKEKRDLNSVEALKNAVIASHPGYGLEPKLKRLLPDAVIVHAVDPQGMFRLVASGKADAVIHGLASGEFMLQKNLISNVVSHGEFLAKGESRLQAAEFVVRKDLPHLMSIIDKTYASIEEAEKQAIWNRWFGKNASGVKTSSLILTDQERAWIAQKHTVQVRFWQYPPYFYLKKGKVVGLSVDLLNLVSEKSGITFQFENRIDLFSDVLRGLKKHKGPDLVGALMSTTERKKDILFTKPYINSPRFIFTRDSAPFVSSIEHLFGKKVAVVNDYAVHRDLTQRFPDIDLLITNTSEEALRSVSSGAAFAFIGDLISTPAMINQFGLKNLKAACPSGLPDHPLSMGVRKDWTELWSIINKTLETLSAAEMATIINRWSTVKIDYGIKPGDVWKWVLIVASMAISIISLFVLWNRSLTKQVRARTADLLYQATLLENVSDAVFSVDLDYKLISWNKACEDIYGWKTEEVIGTVFAELTSIEYQDCTREEALTQIKTQGRWRGEVLQHRKDREIIYVQASISLVRNENGEEIGYVGVNRDITEQKKNEAKVRESKEYFSKAFYSQTVPMAILNIKTGERIDFNDSYLHLTGYSREELKQETLFSLVIWDDPHEQTRALETLRKKRRVAGYPCTMMTKTGEARHLVGSAAMLEFGEGNLAITAWVDITERKQAEEKVLEYQARLKALATQLTITEEVERSRIAAELHDHIGQILAFSHIQVGRAQRFSTEEKIQGILEGISSQLLESIQYTKALVFDLSSPLLHELGLTTAIADWLEHNVSRKNDIKTELIGSYRDISLSRDLQSILFRNVRELLANVIKHSQAAKVTVSLEKNSSDLFITVHDDGVGFELDQETIGDVSSKKFGLFSIRERLEDFGGTLDIISSPGTGCKIIMTIPNS